MLSDCLLETTEQVVVEGGGIGCGEAGVGGEGEVGYEEGRGGGVGGGGKDEE